MTAASAMTAIGRRLARRTGTGSTRNGGDVMATVCVWLSTLAGSRSGRRGAWMVGARYHPDSPTPASLASGWEGALRPPGSRPLIVASAPCLSAELQHVTPQERACGAVDVGGRPGGGSCAYWGRRIPSRAIQDQCAI